MESSYGFIVFMAVVYALGIVTPAFLEVNAMESVQAAEIGSDYFAQSNLVAIRNDGQGVLNTANVKIREGSGRVLISTMPFIEPETQFSLETAKDVAEEYTGISLDNKDVIFSVSDTDADLIGGPSAGASFTAATIAAIQGKKVNSEITVTGTIQPDGTIGFVGGLVEKIKASAGHQNTIFLIPKGQALFSSLEEETVTKSFGIFSYQTKELVMKQTDLYELGEQLGIQVKEVGNVKDVIDNLLI